MEYEQQEKAQQQPPPLERATSVQKMREYAGKHKVIGFCIPFLFVVALASGLAFWFSRGDSLDIILSIGIDEFRQEDPFNATTPDEADRWDTMGRRGLELRVINALESRWHPFFDEAINDWESGEPDPLTLSTKVMPVDPECEAETGRLKVCNGNYGDTRWRGLNLAMISFGKIISSTAKMNEYYLRTAPNSRKQYTMCHEIGHGFGLPHSDERFWNRDLGNCMDYTNRNVRGNMRPDTSNFEFLTAMYGTVTPAQPGAAAAAEGDMGGGAQQQQDSSTTSGGNPYYTKNNNYDDEKDKDKDKEDEGDDRRRRGLRGSVVDDVQEEQLPAWVMEQWRIINQEMSTPSSNATTRRRQGWRLLHESEFGVAHEVDLGEGYTVRVHALLHKEDDDGDEA